MIKTEKNGHQQHPSFQMREEEWRGWKSQREGEMQERSPQIAPFPVPHLKGKLPVKFMPIYF